MRAGASTVTQEGRARVLLPAEWPGPSSVGHKTDVAEMFVRLEAERPASVLGSKRKQAHKHAYN